MSMIDAMAQPQRPREQEAPVADETLQQAEAPIVPRATISGRALVAVIAIMTFLASLTSGAVIVVSAAAKEWQSEVGREVTIQIRPAAGRDLEADIARAAAAARATPGVTEVRAYSREESTRLLEPWLGTGVALEELPIPRIVVVRIAPGGTPDLSELRKRLSAQIPGAVLDDHRGFVDRMRRISNIAAGVGVGVFLLVLAATILSVTFATRAAMATNAPVIEVLHLIGARNKFIAGHFQRHFLRLALQGGLIGGGGAALMFVLADGASGWLLGFTDDEQFGALFGSPSVGISGYLAVLVQVGVIAAVTAATCRRIVNRTIASVCGTDGDPQGLALQEGTLREAGVLLAPSNAAASRLAGKIALAKR